MLESFALMLFEAYNCHVMIARLLIDAIGVALMTEKIMRECLQSS